MSTLSKREQGIATPKRESQRRARKLSAETLAQLGWTKPIKDKKAGDKK